MSQIGHAFTLELERPSALSSPHPTLRGFPLEQSWRFPFSSEQTRMDLHESRDGRTVIALAWDALGRRTRAAIFSSISPSPRSITALPTEGPLVTSALSEDGSALLLCSHARRMVWRVGPSEADLRVPEHERLGPESLATLYHAGLVGSCCAIEADGLVYAVARPSRFVDLYDVKGGHTLIKIAGDKPITSLAFSARTLLVGCETPLGKMTSLYDMEGLPVRA